MKKIVYSLLVLLMVFSVSCNQSSQNNAQPSLGGPGGGGNGPGNFDPQAMLDRQMEQMKERLNLKDEQEKQIRDIMSKGFDEMRKMREEMRDNGGGGNFEGMREQMQQMREEQNKKIKAILSENQWYEYEAMQEEMRSRRGQGRPQQN